MHHPAPATKGNAVHRQQAAPRSDRQWHCRAVDEMDEHQQIGDSASAKISLATSASARPRGIQATVGGVIQSTSGGVKFPDGTVQTTAFNKTSSPACSRSRAVFTAAFRRAVVRRSDVHRACRQAVGDRDRKP